MANVVRDTNAMIAGMAPMLDPQVYVFAAVSKALPEGIVPISSFHEDEGLSVIVTLDQAHAMGLDVDLPMQRITLSVHSALDGVGLTAAVATVLADHGIACNMVAGYHHDHAFVPASDAQRAVDVLSARAKEVAI